VILKKTVEWVLLGICWNKGEVCSATSRLIVEKSIASKFTEELIEKSKKIKVGDGLSKDSKIGPIISEPQYKKVLNYIDSGVKEGAKLVFGGKKPKISEETPEGGYFV